MGKLNSDSGPRHDYNLRPREKPTVSTKAKKNIQLPKTKRGRTSREEKVILRNNQVKETIELFSPKPDRQNPAPICSKYRNIAPSPVPSQRGPRRSSPVASPPLSRSVSNTSIPDQYKVSERTPVGTFEDLAGIDDIKEELIEYAVWPFVQQNAAKKVGLEAPKGILLTGKPGTGKTMLVDAMVNEMRKLGHSVRYFQESGQCLSKWVGESEGHIRDLFRMAHENQPSIIFLDEIDGLARGRENSNSAVNHTLITTLLHEINNVERGKVMLIAATNVKNMVDPAVIRKGRFDLTVPVKPPNHEAQKLILQHYFKKASMKVKEGDLKWILEMTTTKELTGSDLEGLVKNIHRNSIKRLFPKGAWWKNKDALENRAQELENVNKELDILPALEKLDWPEEE